MGKLRTIIRKTDSNHKEIVGAFRRLGWSVLDIHTISNSADILVAKAGYQVLVEIQGWEALPASQRKLTEGEEEFWRTWLGPLIMILNVDEVIEFDRKRHTPRSYS